MAKFKLTVYSIEVETADEVTTKFFAEVTILMGEDGMIEHYVEGASLKGLTLFINSMANILPDSVSLKLGSITNSVAIWDGDVSFVVEFEEEFGL